MVSVAPPSGRATYLARVAAVLAGPGTPGLNEMLLTAQFGPCSFVGALLTDRELAPHAPLAASIADTRGLDAPAYMRASRPYGPEACAEHVKCVFLLPSEEARIGRAGCPH
jgi:hypothetical protein